MVGIAIAVLLVLLVAGVYVSAKVTKWRERLRIKFVYLVREGIRLEREATRDERGRFTPKPAMPEVVTTLPKIIAKPAVEPSFEQMQSESIAAQEKYYEHRQHDAR